MRFAPILKFLAAGILFVTDLTVWARESTPGLQSSIETLALQTTSKVNCPFSTSKEDHASAVSVPPFAKTTICTKHCVVLTLSTLMKPTGSSTSRVPRPPAIWTSCLTAPGTTADHSESSSPFQSLVSTPTTAVYPEPSTPSQSVVSVPTTLGHPESSIPIRSLGTVPISIARTLSSSTSPLTVLTATTSSSALGLEPCSTDITVTKTIVETWWSTAPVTTRLARTRSITITTVVVETYSTSTGETTLLGTRTTTATLTQVSIDTTCLGVKNCCGVCPTPTTSESRAQDSSLPGSSIVTGFESQRTVMEPTTPTTEAGITSTSAAGAAKVTAGLIGALVGLLVVLA